MTKREVLNSEITRSLLSGRTNNAIDDFLNYYKSSKRSQSSYRSGVNKLLLDDLAKEAHEITFADYMKVMPQNKNQRTPQDTYKEMFIKFLFVFDYLEDPRGFSSIWIKEDIIKGFTDRTELKKRNIVTKNVSDSLTVPELTAIQKVLEKDFTKLELQKMDFCWYMLFQEGCIVEELKEIKSENLVNGVIITNTGDEYIIPSRFYPMFERLNERESGYTGFYTVNTLIAELGEMAKLERRLTPMIIKKTRNSSMVKCCNCGETYWNTINNWVAVNSRLVCVSCAEEIKKKLNFDHHIINIPNQEFTSISKEHEINLSSVLYSYNELKKRIKSKPIDYLKLHELQIEIGKLGEAFVYEKECEKLKGTKYEGKIDNKKAIDPKNGYDILSFDINGKPIYIEVKATAGIEDRFYLSNHEYQTAEKMKENNMNYAIYFVKEVMSDNPKLIKIHDIIDNEEYNFEEMNWKVTRI